MSFLKFQFLVLLSVALFATRPTSLGIQAQYESPFPSAIKGGGSIIMADVILAITLNNPEDHITYFQVVNANQELVLQGESCGSSSCEHDLSSLSPGSYTVNVHTEQNDSFSGVIEF